MNITAIISEYNPLHNGHIYQFNTAVSQTKPDLTIAIMSGNFVQRGQMAVLPKDVRAKLAINNGFDMVIELPTVFAVNNAEVFSYGAINLIKNLQNVTLSFGSECGDIDELTSIADLTKTNDYNNLLKQYLAKNYSYPTATNLAIKELSNTDTFDYSNNILAIEYIKNVEKLNKNIKLHTVKRVNNFNNNNIVDNFMSATNLRSLIDKTEAKNYMPKNSYDAFRNFNINNDNFNNFALSKLFDISTSELSNIYDVTEGLENRIKQTLNEVNNYDDFINKLQTKRYSKSKLNRIVINALLNITKNDVNELKNTNYIKVLAIKKEKLDALGYLNKYTKVITKYADTKLLNDKELALLEYDNRATKLYSLINNINIENNMIIVE